VPDQATKLFLGFADSFNFGLVGCNCETGVGCTPWGYNNSLPGYYGDNSGSLNVTLQFDGVCVPNCDGVISECEEDCDADGMEDQCEEDCNCNGTHDPCESSCNNTGIPDDCWSDCNNYPDGCERTVYVKQGATGNGDGSSWANAYPELRTALAAATDGDNLWVAQGTYKPTDDNSQGVSFELKKNVWLYGGFQGVDGETITSRKPAVYKTILSGAILRDRSLHVVTATDIQPSCGYESADIGSTAILDGFTIRWGLAQGSLENGQGAGLLLRNASVRIQNCWFELNQASQGSAIACTSGSMPTIVNCTFSGNTASSSSMVGGTIYSDEASSPNIVNCTFSRNLGGGVLADAYATVANCILWDNMPAEVTGALIQMSHSDVKDRSADAEKHIINAVPRFIRLPYGGVPSGTADGGRDGIDDDYGNLRLRKGSPCIDAGNMAALPVFALACVLDPDMRPRVLDGLGLAPQIATVDMGAYETPSYDASAATTDWNGDGIMDLEEIGTVHCGWQNQTKCTDCNNSGWPDEVETDGDSLLDFNRDCSVDAIDFAYIQRCMTLGDMVQVAQACREEDLSGDYFVDGPTSQVDVNLFVQGATGPSLPANPSLGDINLNVLLDASRMEPDDIDADGITDDSDQDGIKWENPCTGGSTTGCDDNCKYTPNLESPDICV
jgi:hypothetical protein